MKERIKKMRKALGLTQQALADKLGISRSNIASYESGNSIPGDATINLICRELNIREEWLRYSKGEMLKPNPSYAIDILAREHNLTHGEYILIEKFVNMKPEYRKAILDYVMEVANSINGYNIEPAEPAYSEKHIDIDAEVAAFREELELQEKAKEKSSALRTTK